MFFFNTFFQLNFVLDDRGGNGFNPREWVSICTS